MLSAIRMYEHGLATKEDIDTGMKLGCGYPMGPFELLDYVGLDTTLYAAEAIYEEYPDPAYAPPTLLRRMVQAGRMARRTARVSSSIQRSARSEHRSWRAREPTIQLRRSRNRRARRRAHAVRHVHGRAAETCRRLSSAPSPPRRAERAGVDAKDMDQVVFGNVLQTARTPSTSRATSPSRSARPSRHPRSPSTGSAAPDCRPSSPRRSRYCWAKAPSRWPAAART